MEVVNSLKKLKYIEVPSLDNRHCPVDWHLRELNSGSLSFDHFNYGYFNHQALRDGRNEACHGLVQAYYCVVVNARNYPKTQCSRCVCWSPLSAQNHFQSHKSRKIQIRGSFLATSENGEWDKCWILGCRIWVQLIRAGKTDRATLLLSKPKGEQLRQVGGRAKLHRPGLLIQRENMCEGWLTTLGICSQAIPIFFVMWAVEMCVKYKKLLRAEMNTKDFAGLVPDAGASVYCGLLEEVVR